MPHIDAVAMSVGALANATAENLARQSITNIELREAISTVKLGPGEIRVGAWDITLLKVQGDKFYSIRSSKSPEIVLEGIAFYDTAQMIVRMLNRGGSPRCFEVNQITLANDQFVRFRDESRFQRLRAAEYDSRGDYIRADQAEELAELAEARANILYHVIVPPRRTSI